MKMVNLSLIWYRLPIKFSQVSIVYVEYCDYNHNSVYCDLQLQINKCYHNLTQINLKYTYLQT